MQEIRYLDKLVDELAKGKKMEKILRKAENKSVNEGKSQAAETVPVKPTTIDAYIVASPANVQEILQKVRATLQAVLPNATEKISWSMPTYWDGHNIIHFTAMKNHVGLYPGPDAIEYFSNRLDEMGFKHSKGAAQFPYKKEMPYDLITEIAVWCSSTGNHA